MATQRFSITEYDAPTALVSDIARATSLSPQRVSDYLQSAGDRTAHVLKFSSNPLPVVGQRVQAMDFAGLLRAGPAIELEIVPKFLGSGRGGWREDFFFLAMLSRHGRLLSNERLRALSAPNADLATLVARALVQMYWDQHRRPIRIYRRIRATDFALDGEVEPEDLSIPNEEGFLQTVVRYDRNNKFNAAIKLAANTLAPLVRDAEARASLERIGHLLGGQPAPRTVRPARLPSRARSWQATYDLAFDVLRGFGLTYDTGRALAPGFLLSTWQVWENLVTISLRSQLGGRAVAAQKSFQLGHRQRHSEAAWGRRRAFEVTPDLAVDGTGAGFGNVLIDAKYKGRWHQGRQRISEADIYEAMAFGRAARADKIVLIYPKIATGSQTATGSTEVFERVDVEGLEIWGVEAEVRGISRAGGLKHFAQGLIAGLRTVHDGLAGAMVV
jgi:5-methylcytosine-specific restriction enzyme subunit McrC